MKPPDLKLIDWEVEPFSRKQADEIRGLLFAATQRRGGTGPTADVLMQEVVEAARAHDAYRTVRWPDSDVLTYE